MNEGRYSTERQTDCQPVVSQREKRIKHCRTGAKQADLWPLGKRESNATHRLGWSSLLLHACWQCVLLRYPEEPTSRGSAKYPANLRMRSPRIKSASITGLYREQSCSNPCLALHNLLIITKKGANMA